MKKTIAIFLLCLMILSAGCANPSSPPANTAQTAAIANPWSDWDSIAEAETAAGFAFGLPAVIAGQYTAEVFRTLNSQLIEVVYRDGDTEICVRKQKGEGQDISGDYNQYDTCTEEIIGTATVIHYRNSGDNALKQLISDQGFSWSLVAENGFPGDSNHDFLRIILGQ